MKKVIFFTENSWAFGNIHHSVCKELFKFGIYGNVLDWGLVSDIETMQQINDAYDVFVTTPYGVPLLINHGIPLEKIVSFAHGESELYQTSVEMREIYHRLGGFAVMSSKLSSLAETLGFSATPDLVKIGIHTGVYKTSPATELRNVGYAAAMNIVNYHGVEIKRGNLVEYICDVTDTNFIKASVDKNATIAMTGFYKSVDAVMMSSVEETCGLPMLEAAAAGRLCIGTPVGYFEEHAMKGGGILVGMGSEQYMEESIRTIQYFRKNNTAFRKVCADVQNYAIENYDWKYVIEDWVNLINRV